MARLYPMGEFKCPYVAKAEKLSVMNITKKIPKMIKISDYNGKGKLSIMNEPVTIGLFSQVMKCYNGNDFYRDLYSINEGAKVSLFHYGRIGGHNVNKLKALLNHPSKASETLLWASLKDAIVFASQLSSITGRKFRVPTYNEWREGKYPSVYKNGDGEYVMRHRNYYTELQGKYYFEWTTTVHTDYYDYIRGKTYTIGCHPFDNPKSCSPDKRLFPTAIRLVEDLA